MGRFPIFELIIATAAAALVGCAHQSGGTRNASDQVAAGAKLYAASCAECHGAAGQGTEMGPPLVGNAALPLHPRPGAKRDVDFRTAKDVALWVKANMPAGKGNSLPLDDYLAILAFDLQASGVDLHGKPIELANLDGFVLHP